VACAPVLTYCVKQSRLISVRSLLELEEQTALTKDGATVERSLATYVARPRPAANSTMNGQDVCELSNRTRFTPTYVGLQQLLQRGNTRRRQTTNLALCCSVRCKTICRCLTRAPKLTDSRRKIWNKRPKWFGKGCTKWRTDWQTDWLTDRHRDHG